MLRQWLLRGLLRRWHLCCRLPTPEEVSDIAQHCNDTKNSAKAVQVMALMLVSVCQCSVSPVEIICRQ